MIFLVLTFTGGNDSPCYDSSSGGCLCSQTGGTECVRTSRGQCAPTDPCLEYSHANCPRSKGCRPEDAGYFERNCKRKGIEPCPPGKGVLSLKRS